MALNIYSNATPDQADGLMHLVRGLPMTHREEFRRLIRQHGKDAVYAIPKKFDPKTKRLEYLALPFEQMTRDECRDVLDMMLGKRKRDQETEALKSEQEAIANQTYRNPKSDTYDPWRCAKERMGIKS